MGLRSVPGPNRPQGRLSNRVVELNRPATGRKSRSADYEIEDLIDTARQLLGLVKLSCDLVTFEDWRFRNHNDRKRWIEEHEAVVRHFAPDFGSLE